MAEKKTRRERLSARDHRRAVHIGNAAIALLGVLEQMYPTDLELRIAQPALSRFIDDTARTAQEMERFGDSAGEPLLDGPLDGQKVLDRP